MPLMGWRSSTWLHYRVVPGLHLFFCHVLEKASGRWAGQDAALEGEVMTWARVVFLRHHSQPQADVVPPPTWRSWAKREGTADARAGRPNESRAINQPRMLPMS
jgi:hypothetical protein